MASEMKQRAVLKSEIAAVIAEYEHRATKPPFSMAEIVVMAILWSEEKRPRKYEICLWILEKFKYYRDQAIDETARKAVGMALPSSYTPLDDVYGVWYDYEVPLTSDITDLKSAHNLEERFSVPINEGRIFLRHVLQDPPQGTFRFLELPAEIRIRVYEMVFSFPGMRIPSSMAPGAVTFCKRDHEPYGSQEDTKPEFYYSGPPIRQTLEFLTTNKQIYNESVPLFYRINHFHFDCLCDLSLFVERLAPDRLQYLRHIHIEYNQGVLLNRDKIKAAINELVYHNGIRKLEIVTEDREWFGVINALSSWRRYTQYSEPALLPYMLELTQLVGILDELNFRGACPRVQEYLRAHMKSKTG